jgi:hypothetical protein
MGWTDKVYKTRDEEFVDELSLLYEIIAKTEDPAAKSILHRISSRITRLKMRYARTTPGRRADPRDDLTMPEGFLPNEDGTFRGVPPWAMREANMLCASLTGNRSYDVPLVGETLADVFDARMNEILNSVRESLTGVFVEQRKERMVTHEQLNTPLDAAARLQSGEFNTKKFVDEFKAAARPTKGLNFPCPICNGVEGCDHSVPERLRAVVQLEVSAEVADKIKDGRLPEVSIGAVVSNEADPHKQDAKRLSSDDKDLLGFFLSVKDVNMLQVGTVLKTIDQAKTAHHTDIKLRIDGADYFQEGDWVKHLKPVRTDRAMADEATLAFLKRSSKLPDDLEVDWTATRSYRFSEWRTHVVNAISVFLGVTKR